MPENKTPAAKRVAISSDTKWIIGTLVTSVFGMAGVLTAVMTILIGNVSTQVGALNDRINRLQTEVNELRGEMRDSINLLRGEMREDNRAIRTRLRGVEVALGRVDRTFLPTVPDPAPETPGQPENELPQGQDPDPRTLPLDPAVRPGSPD